MKAWEGIKLYENIVCKTGEDLFLLIQEALRAGDGALIRVFSSEKDGAYLHFLFDDEKLLLAEAVFIRTGGRLKGNPVVRYLISLLENPVIADVYALDDGEVKKTVLANLDLYNETPHVLLFDIFTPKLWLSSPTPLKSDAEIHLT